MEIEKLKVLMLAAELGSLNKAAESLKYTQAGLTRMMNSLENEVGFQLLNRRYNGVSLTDEAKSLMPTIRKLVQNYDALNEEMEHIRNAHKKTIHVATLTSVASQWIPVIIKRFSKLHPDVNVDFQIADLLDAADQLLGDAEMDIVFTSMRHSTKTKGSKFSHMGKWSMFMMDKCTYTRWELAIKRSYFCLV